MSLSLLTIALTGCAGLTQSWQAPEVALVAVQPRELGLARQVFAVTLAVKNPNDRTLPIEAMTYRLSVEGEEVARGGGELERRIPANGETTVDVEVVGSLLGLAQRLPLLMQSDRPLDWTVSGTVAIAGGLVSLPYSHSGKLDPGVLVNGAGL